MKNYQQLKTEALEAFSQHGKVGQKITFPEGKEFFTIKSSAGINLLNLGCNLSLIFNACEDLQP